MSQRQKHMLIKTTNAATAQDWHVKCTALELPTATQHAIWCKQGQLLLLQIKKQTNL